MRSVILVTVLLLLVFHTTPGFAQETTGRIEGQLRDDQGKPVAFANIVVSGSALQGSRGVMSTSDGYFGIFKLPVGAYTVKISHVSYQGLRIEDVLVKLGMTTTVGEVVLTTALHEAPAIIVTAEKKLIDPTTAATAMNLSSEEFRDLPINRDYQRIPALLPHANESFFGDGVNFAGSPGEETKYFVDGVETTDPTAGTSGTSLPYNFVRDIQVKTGGYAAEYRSSLGGIVNVISHSGGNEFHGQVFGFFLNNQFSGEPRLSFENPPETDYALYDVGLSLGGPIMRDRLWFFAAYNPNFVTEDVEVLGVGLLEDKTVRHIFSAKLDWKVARKSRVNVTVTGDPGKRDAVESRGWIYTSPDPVLTKVTDGGVNLLAKGTHMFSDALFLEASVSGITRRHKTEAATTVGQEEIAFIDHETGTASGGTRKATDARSVQITADINATIILGRHEVKAGLAYRDNHFDFDEEWRVLERFVDTTGAETYSLGEFTTVNGSVSNRIPSAYIQDSWRVTDRVRLNAGLRWDGQYLIGSDGEVAQTILDQYQPRIGVVYQPGKLGTQKVFGSVGRFYQELHTWMLNFNYNQNSSIKLTLWDHDPRVDPSGGFVPFELPGAILDEVDGLKGQYYDEISLGYERQVGTGFIIGVRGIYRRLGMGIEDGTIQLDDAALVLTIGNPGHGLMSEYPEMKREYRALEFTAQLFGGARYSARASYVLSRNYGNYRGLYGSPNFGPEFDMVQVTVNSTGHLENDRTHVFKLSGSYLMGFGLSAGTSFWFQSGTPLSVREATTFGPPQFNYAQDRGTASPYGTTTRTPEIWDLNFRFVYDLAYAMKTTVRTRLILDILHVGSKREAVDYDQLKNFHQDDMGNQIDPNPTFGLATRYQPPTAIRLGFEIDF